jgi:hypothetical protein
MTINRTDIENITEADIQELKDNAVGEGILYDYKLDLYGNSDADTPNPIELKRFDPSHLVPPWCMGCDYGFNVDGYWTKSSSDTRSGYLQVFRNGIVETAAAGIRTPSTVGPYILAEDIEDQIATKVSDCLLSLQRADVPLPAYVMLAGVRMRGTYIIKGPALIEPKALPLSDRFELPPAIIENYSTIEEYRQALKPLFDAVWNAAGYESSQSYDQDGKWKR